MDAKTCPRCSAPLSPDAPHACEPGGAARISSAASARPTQRPAPSAPPAATKPALAPAIRPPESEIVTQRRVEGPPPEITQLARDPSKVVGQYVLGEMLGKGAMGTVWKAWDTKLTRWVAIKFLMLEGEAGVKRFEREARLAARLRHPNIAAIYDVGEDKGRHYIAMEYIDGTSLGKANLPLRPNLEAMAKVARAVDEAHKSGVIHRDLKPENLMVTKAGWPYVMDFGLAKMVETESSLSVSGDVMGTPVYMSPEQAKGENETLEARTDVYALGATLYTLATGQRPFSGRNAVEVLMKVVHQDVIPPRKVKADLPESVEAIILKSMEKDRYRRYPTAQALAEDLERFLAGKDVLAKLPSLSTLILRRIRRNLWPAALGMVLLVACGVALVSWSARAGGSAAEAWKEGFRREQQALEYMKFRPGDPQLPDRVHALLARLDTLPSGDAGDVVGWFRDQVEIAEEKTKSWAGLPRAEWSKLRENAAHAAAWCEAVAAALKGLKGDLGGVAARVPAIRQGAESLLAYRGEFTLRIAVAPYARIKELRRAGQSVPVKDPETPTVIGDLEIDDYEIELAHPALAPQKVLLPASRLQDGVTYTLGGDLRKPETLRITP